ncbi:hypothetical protein WG66_005699 [Moniliophthora roreri]|nr:hypothetical protein WG66_005699 [Moniliophthora roreri]
MNANVLGEAMEMPAGSGSIPFPPHLIGSYITVATLGLSMGRLIALIILMGTVIFLTVPLDRYCSIFALIGLSLLPTFVIAESLLLFFRVRAIYLGQRRVVMAFLVLFLIVVASSALIPFTGTGSPAGPTNSYCTVSESTNMQLSAVLIIIPLINKIFIFLAISYKLVPPRFEEGESAHWQKWLVLDLRTWAFWRGKDLPMLSRTLWQDGQIYILIFILTTVVAVVPMSVANVPVIYRSIFLVPHIAIENSMNSYLFRSIRATMTSLNRCEVDETPHICCSNGRTRGVRETV